MKTITSLLGAGIALCILVLLMMTIWKFGLSTVPSSLSASQMLSLVLTAPFIAWFGINAMMVPVAIVAVIGAFIVVIVRELRN